MKIGVPKEIKTHEYRVGMTPECVRAYLSRGHVVTVQAGAGLGAGFSDEEYTSAGAKICPKAADVYSSADMIVKVKEPVASEYGLFHSGQILYTYLHLAADKPQAMALLAAGVKAVAYETIELADGSLPCLKPMSEIAGRLSVQEGAKYLEKPFGGRGVLLGGVPGIKPGRVVVLGGGVVGTNACKMAVGLGADVTVLDVSARRLEYLDDIFGGRLKTLYATQANIAEEVKTADLVIGAVLLAGAKTPNLVKREMLATMNKGAVIVDVAVDQGGCVETTRPTTHDDPTFVVDGVVHYCVANMPGAVARSSTLALTSTTLDFGLQLADNGVEKACRESCAIRKGLNIYCGRCTCEPVACALNIEYDNPTF
ncbi:MAG TPA: alanine dehydrogenase [Phycisphaerae bacterium]|nr:alanine dehydrogenase [Phycisphaerae bacterium]